MKIQAITLEEWKYTYSQSQQIAGMTGCIGHLRGDFGKDGLGFYSTWFDRRSDLKTAEFPGLMKKAFSHTGLVEMIRWKKKIDPEHYILAFIKRPILEQIVKAGLYELADDLLKDQFALKENLESKLTKALEIDRNRLQRMRRLHGGYQHLK